MFYDFQSYLYSSALSLAAISVFLRVGFLLKLFLMVVSLSIHITLFSTLSIFKSYHDIHNYEDR